MSRTMLQLSACVLLIAPAMASAEPEVLPPPREVVRLIHIEAIKSGYQVTLSREGAELLRAGLGLLGDGKAASDIAKQVAKKRNDPELDKQIEFLSLILKTQAPAIKKALDEKAGPNGAVIRVFGIEKKRLPERPLLKSLGEAFLPDDWKEVLQTGVTVINTTPIWWRVEGRN
jgi:hypothetical protein